MNFFITYIWCSDKKSSQSYSGQAIIEKKTFKYFMVLYLYIAQGQGQITQGVNFDPN